MRPRVRRWRKGDPEDVAAWASPHEQFFVLDPGATGALCRFPDVRGWAGEYAAPTWWEHVEGFDVGTAVRTMRRSVWRGDVVLVVEEGFGSGRANVSSDLQLARYAGAFVGAAFAHVGLSRVRVVWVPAASWQAATIGAKGKRPERKKRARAVADAVIGAEGWCGEPEKVRDPVSDVVCMAGWWAGLCRERGRTVVQGADGDG